MNRLYTLDDVVTRAKAHGIHVEHTQANPPTVSMQPCPACHDGFDALAVWDGISLMLLCQGCDDPPAIRAALLKEPESVAAVDTFRTYTPTDLLEFPDPEWLVEPFLVDGSFHVLFGPSGTYKSFVAIDWAARAPGLAVYISAEGSPKKLGARITAWEQAAGTPARVLCIPHAVNMIDTDDATKLAATLRELGEPVRLLVVDTAARNMAGGDENSTRDMGMLVGALDQVRAEFGCAVLVLHHTGHENTERERGSSALRGAADVSVRARKPQGTKLQVRLECAKVRDSAEFETMVVRLLPFGGSLVAARAAPRGEVVEQEVRDHLAEHPAASQNDVESAVTGKASEVRAAYQKVRPARKTAGRTPGQGASQRPPSKGDAVAVPFDPTLDPDEHKRLQEDGGF
jgi:hypothetical protein